MVSVRCSEKLPPCLIKSVLAGSKMDPPLAKAKPISDGVSTSGITQLRRGKKNCWEMAFGERSETMRKKQLCRHQGQ